MKLHGWAIDLGNTHTRVAFWDEARNAPALLELPAICRQPGETEPLAAPQLIPSATEVLTGPDWAAQFGQWPFIRQNWFIGRRACIGRPALQRSAGQCQPGFVPAFKPFLDRESLRPLVRVDRRVYTARDVAGLFLRELLAEIKRVAGLRLREAVFTTPVEAFETYRAEISALARHEGIHRVRFIDEPVAAGLGYGLGLGRDRLVLVVDFGGGTLHMALLSISVREAEAGESRVLAKAGRHLGGNQVDEWLLSEYCHRSGFALESRDGGEEQEYWRRLMLMEARRVKESLFFKPSALFQIIPPDHMRTGVPRPENELPWLEISREDFLDLLKQQGLFRILGTCLDEVSTQAARHGIGEQQVEDVLLVGGSTLLPEVYSFFETRFGRDRVRAWQPFQAVAFGAAAFAAGRLNQSDFIIHDYAFVTYDAGTGEKQYTIIVPRGTRFPAPEAIWQRQLVPACALGEPETMFKMQICEVGRRDERRAFLYDERGMLSTGNRINGTEEPVIVPLNEANPTLGRLDPPHSPRDRRPRLEVSFTVDDQRWLCTTVQDLYTRKWLLKDTRVVRLL